MLWLLLGLGWFDDAAPWRPAWLERVPPLPLALSVLFLLALALAVLFRLPLAWQGAAGT